MFGLKCIIWPRFCASSSVFFSLKKKKNHIHIFNPSLKLDAFLLSSSFWFYPQNIFPKSLLPELIEGFSVPPPNNLTCFTFMVLAKVPWHFNLPLNNCYWNSFPEGSHLCIDVLPLLLSLSTLPMREIQTLPLTFQPVHRTMTHLAPLPLTFDLLCPEERQQSLQAGPLSYRHCQLSVVMFLFFSIALFCPLFFRHFFS